MLPCTTTLGSCPRRLWRPRPTVRVGPGCGRSVGRGGWGLWRLWSRREARHPAAVGEPFPGRPQPASPARPESAPPRCWLERPLSQGGVRRRPSCFRGVWGPRVRDAEGDILRGQPRWGSQRNKMLVSLVRDKYAKASYPLLQTLAGHASSNLGIVRSPVPKDSPQLPCLVSEDAE